MARLFKVSLLLLALSRWGDNLATLLHELGHALSVWATGGIVERITVHPFSWSHAGYGSPPKLPILTESAGFVFGTGSALLLVALVWRFRHQPWSLIFIMTGIAATASNGFYAVIDSIVLSGGDATSLIRIGVTAPLIIGVASCSWDAACSYRWWLYVQLGLASRARSSDAPWFFKVDCSLI